MSASFLRAAAFAAKKQCYLDLESASSASSSSSSASSSDDDDDGENDYFWDELGRALEACPMYSLRTASPRPSFSDCEEESSLHHHDHAKRMRFLLQEEVVGDAAAAASRKTSSSYRGVSLCAKDSRWQARIRIKKEVVYLGRFETEELAARKYDEAAREHHGDRALINFITNEDRLRGRKSAFEQAGGKSARV